MPSVPESPLPPSHIHTYTQPSDQQRLYKDSVLLEDEKSLADLRVENDDVLALTYKREGKWGGVGWGAAAGAHCCVLLLLHSGG